MPKKITSQPDEEHVQDPVPEKTQDSPAKAAFRQFIKKYAEQNPEKYAQKKQALEEKLNSL